ncbi:TonB-dependent receptor [Novilysobacter antarcticus]|uniref:TonB-dependent receptor n=1 Tax=Novilysobacter antarcticus TaxID=2862543 RepID=UPI001C99ED31|nr:TonB-dependent receptor [Lysobacter antarcticus]
MTTPRPKLLSACIAATLFVAAPQAFAQQAETQPADQTPPATATSEYDATATQLDTVTVTARGISESLQKAPLPISVISSKQIEEQGLVDVNDIAAITPSFSFRSGYGRGFDRPVIRGMSNIQGEPNASFFIDGIFVVGDVTSYGLDNIQRVEVIRGPQSAEFGRRTFAGAVNFITQRPGSSVGGKVTLGGGNYGSEKLGVFYSGGSEDGSFGYDLSLTKRGNDAIYFNDYSGKTDLGDTETQSFMAAAAWAPIDNLEITARVMRQKSRDGHFAIDLLGVDKMNCYLPEYTGGVGPGGFPVLASRKKGYYCGDIPGPNEYGINTSEFVAAGWMPGRKTDLSRNSLVFDYAFDNGWNFTSTSAYNETVTYAGTDQDYSSMRGLGGGFESINQTNLMDWSQDLRVSTDQSLPVSGKLGLYYYNQSSHPGFFGDLSGFVLPGNKSVTPYPTNPQDSTINKAIYAMVNWRINDQWTASAEGRYAQDEISAAATDNKPLGGVMYSQSYSLAEKFKSFTPRVTLSYQAADNINIYGLYSEGTKPGGFNTSVYRADLSDAGRDQLIARGLESFKEEEATNYELGIKSDWLDQSLRVNASLYQINWDNQQLTETGAVARKDGSFFSTSYTTNVGETRIRGFELETQWLFAQGWLGSFNYSYNDAEIINFFSQAQADLFCADPTSASSGAACASSAGNTLPRAPKHSASLGLTYDGTFSNGWGWTAYGDASYEGRRYVQVDNLASIAPSTRTNFRFAVSPNDALQVSAFVTNAFNDRTPEDVQRTLDPSKTVWTPNVPPLVGPGAGNLTDFAVSPSLPRMYGIEVQYRF